MPFQKGNKLGRGRPRAGNSLSDALRVALKEELPDGRTKLRAIADVLVEKALAGDIGATREVLDRTEGRPSAAAEAKGTEIRPIVINMLPGDLNTM